MPAARLALGVAGGYTRSSAFDGQPAGESDLPDSSHAAPERQPGSLRNDWTRAEIAALFDLPFADLIFQAQSIHRRHFDPNKVQLSTLLSIKTGGCPEDCGYCPQAARYHTGVENEALMSVTDVVEAARAAKHNGASRFCMGAAWRGPKQRDLDKV